MAWMRVVAVLAVVSTTLVFPGAAAVGSDAGPPWSPYRAQDASMPAGARCAFGVDTHVTMDKERIRTLERNPDGTPRLQKIVGQLVIELTNTSTGRTITRNLTGNGIVRYHDGGFTLELQGGHMLVGLAPEHDAGPALLRLGGAGHAITVAADGSRSLVRGSGVVEDLCAALAP